MAVRFATVILADSGTSGFTISHTPFACICIFQGIDHVLQFDGVRILASLARYF